MATAYLALAALLATAGYFHAASGGTISCKPTPMEVVFAVDISSSLMPADFANLKLFLQEIGEHLPIGPTQTRPAVISFSTNVKVEIDLGDANDLASFKRGIDAIPYYRGFTATGQAMQMARRTVFSKSRAGASKLLVVVTDGRANHPGSRAEAIALVRSESAELRAEGIRIHAIGIGSVMLRDELVAIAGSDDYSVINDFGGLKAMVDSMVKEICSVHCDDLGQESFPGQCFSGTQRIVHVSKSHNKALDRCEKDVTYEYKYCGKSHLCKEADVTVEDCVNGIRNVVTTWEDFDVDQQKCVLKRSVQGMDCNTIEECKEPVAEIIFVLDSSASISNPDWNLQMNFVHRMANNMKIGPGAIHVGVVVFGTTAWNDIPLGSTTNKAALLQKISTIKRRTNQNTNTGAGMKLAQSEFRRAGRSGVSQIAIVMTDGESNQKPDAIGEAASLESSGATIMVIAVGSNLKKEELQAIATTPLSEHLFYATDFDKLLNWADKISEEFCQSITPPDPSLCDLPPKRVVSQCYNSLQKVTLLKYEFDAQGRCNKKVVSHTVSPCKVICTDPINGNQYLDGETWTTECASFLCRRPTSQTDVFLPTAQECPGTQNKCFGSKSSQRFACHDDRGQLFGHCNCLAQNGNPLLRVITADVNARP